MFDLSLVNLSQEWETSSHVSRRELSGQKISHVDLLSTRTFPRLQQSGQDRRLVVTIVISYHSVEPTLELEVARFDGLPRRHAIKIISGKNFFLSFVRSLSHKGYAVCQGRKTTTSRS